MCTVLLSSGHLFQERSTRILLLAAVVVCPQWEGNSQVAWEVVVFLLVGKWVPRESIYGIHWLNSLDTGECHGAGLSGPHVCAWVQ